MITGLNRKRNEKGTAPLSSCNSMKINDFRGVTG